MIAVSLPKKFYDRAKALGATKISLEFSGGNDEGLLSVFVSNDKMELRSTGNNDVYKLESDIEEWAYSAYDYSGAGDGTEYGDNIVYDLENNTVATIEWYQERKYTEPVEFALEVEDKNEA
jgi:uncharacterized protein YuzE